jgi:hypothetical protein
MCIKRYKQPASLCLTHLAAAADCAVTWVHVCWVSCQSAALVLASRLQEAGVLPLAARLRPLLPAVPPTKLLAQGSLE